MEQLNIEGKRSGEGLVAYRATFVGALSRAMAERVSLMDVTVGRRGLLAYVKSLGGGNMLKLIPSGGDTGCHCDPIEVGA